MNTVESISTSTARRREAASWFARLQDPNVPARLLQRWKRWEAVPENRRVFDEIVRLNGLLAHVNYAAKSILPAANANEYDGTISVHAWMLARKMRARSRQRLRIAAITIGLAAAFAVSAVGLQWAAPIQWRSIMEGAQISVLETGMAEHKEILLSDGSKISLGAETAITADVTKHARTIVLSRGEALFHVAKDPQRPFRVIAGRGAITAIGTAFNVRRRTDHVVVTVTEGTVQVAPVIPFGDGDTSKGGSRVEATVQKLTRGQEITYDRQGRLSEPRPTYEGFSGSWRDGHLRYSGEPLRNVIPDVNRYSRRPLILADPAAGQLLYSGTVFERNVDDWIVGLQRIYPELEVTVTDTHLLIRTRSDMAQQLP